MEGKFITLHGIDGSGKSTAVEYVVTELSEGGTSTLQLDTASLDTTAYTTSASPFAGFEQSTSLDKKFHQSAAVKDMMASGVTVVKDRWFIDVCADRAFQGLAIPDSTEHILRPDLSVVLHLSDNVRLQRVHDRGNPEPNDLIPNVEGTRAFFFEQFLLENISRFALRSIIIDSTDMSPQQVSQTVVQALE